MIIVTSSWSKSSVHSNENEKPAFLNSSGLKSVFEIAPFWWRISVNGRSNGRNKAGYSNFFCVVWMLSEAGEVNSDVDVLNSRKYKYSRRSKWSTEDKQQRTMKKERN